MNYANDHIRNVLVAGHGGAGKTSLVEAMLYLTKATDRQGRVEDGNTVCDFDFFINLLLSAKTRRYPHKPVFYSFH